MSHLNLACEDGYVQVRYGGDLGIVRESPIRWGAQEIGCIFEVTIWPGKPPLWCIAFDSDIRLVDPLAPPIPAELLALAEDPDTPSIDDGYPSVQAAREALLRAAAGLAA